ncbi:MAG TPA: amidohydrolase family protein [Pyrinomonadaceae bacterium]|nr:amidohydrolase family protein [Pyrinomonadaceae bacterium]
MREKVFQLCAAALLLLGCGGPAGTTGAQSQWKEREVAFVNVNVVPMDSERVLAGQTVLVRGERIVEVGPASKVKVPAAALRVDGRGKYLMPGLAEMHGHIPPPQAPKEFTEAVLFMYVANGVTTVRGMLGAPGQLELRERANRGELLSPTLYLAGPSFNGNSVSSPAQAAEMVRQQKREGWDLLKVHPGLTRDEYDAMARTANEVGIRFAGHVPAEVGLAHALEMRQETIDHVDGYVEHLGADGAPLDEAKLAEVVRLTKKSGAWIVPTMALWETLLGVASIEKLLSFPELRYMPAQQVQNWEKAHRARQASPQFDRKKAELTAANRKRILKALYDGGVPVIFGTDAPQQFSVPGFSVHHEMASMREAGMTPYQILLTATKNAGEYHKNQARFGTVTAGSRADLLLVNGDPLKDLSNVGRRAGVMVRGRWLAEEEIQKRLADIAASGKP